MGAGWSRRQVRAAADPTLDTDSSLTVVSLCPWVSACGNELHVAKMPVIYWSFRLCVFDLTRMKNACLLNHSEGNI